MGSPLLGLKYTSTKTLVDRESFPRVINLNEGRVVAAVQAFIDAGKAPCECDDCQLDLLAISLNNTSPRYIVNDLHRDCFGGTEHRPSNDALDEIIYQAALVVERRPHH